MKIKNLLLFAAAASISMSAFAQTNGELGWLEDGSPAIIGTATTDHLFTRMTYGDAVYDNVISFQGGTPQLVWFWLDDDAIYANEAVQALTPINLDASTVYGEITYNSFQCDIYVPENIQLVEMENEDGDMESFAQGDRLPNTTNITWKKKDDTKVVDGVNYNVYTLLAYNANEMGTHFSSKNAKKYKDNGPLKKDDAALVGLYMHNTDLEQHNMADMIIANQVFNFRESNIAGWTPDQSNFWYMTGGNGEQRFQLYNRVALHGSSDVVETVGEKSIKSVTYYNVAGMESNEPFEGVNIKVVNYNDGTNNTSKVIK